MLSAETERRHLTAGPRPGEPLPPGVTIEARARCAGDASVVLERAREVMQVVIDGGLGEWPDLAEWRRLLPPWFVAASAEEATKEEVDEWLAWWQSLPLDERAEVERRQPWSLTDWLHWLRPRERQWFWWDARVESADALRVLVLAEGWPAPLDALAWLLRAAGAQEVVTE